MPDPTPLYPLIYEPLVRRALEEDLGRAGDLTTDTLIDPGRRAVAHVVAREAGTVAGLDAALSAFRMLDDGVTIRRRECDGARVAAGAVLAVVEGAARPILSAERVGAEPARAAVRDQYDHGARRGGLRRNAGPCGVHPQDDTGAAGAGKIRGAHGRRR